METLAFILSLILIIFVLFTFVSQSSRVYAMRTFLTLVLFFLWAMMGHMIFTVMWLGVSLLNFAVTIYFTYVEDEPVETEEVEVVLPERLFCLHCRTYSLQQDGCCCRCGATFGSDL